MGDLASLAHAYLEIGAPERAKEVAERAIALVRERGLVRFARLFRLATELYDGDEEAAREWLRKPAPALDGETPLDHADTEAGAREVEVLIGRLEHGVYT
jgi:putative toxin-antitoxin system antitoxin component (TIGR02293 family)